jgi:hypothetical protein
VKDVTPLQKDLNVLIVDAEEVYQEALKLWKQWQDSSKDYDCGAPPPVKNAASQCKDGNTKFSPGCSVKCAKGYDGNGTTNQLSCEKVGKFGEELTGEWNGMASCAGRECGVPAHMRHAKTVLQVVRYPEAATYTCLEGFFTPGGGHAYNVPCGADGFFEVNSSHKCKGVTCGKPPQLNGTKPVKGIYHYSEEVSYTCLEGHSLDGFPGGRDGFHTSCQATGKFSHGNLGCQKIRCGPVPNFANTEVSHLTTADQDDQHYGDEAEYTCAPGYTLNQQSDGPNKFTLVCHADGEFSLTGSKGDSQADQPRCKPICIGPPPAIAHGVYTSRDMCFGDSLIVTAELGYSTKASTTEGLSFTIGVSPDGHFEGIENFSPVECGAPPEVVKATTQFGKGVAVYENIVHYECAPGYSTDKTKDPGAKSFAITCQNDGIFSSFPALGGKCANIDDCVGHTCGAHGTCVDHLMNYTCDCESGFAMTWHKEAKQLVCGNIDDCGPEACGVGKCVDEVNSYKCNCPTGYEQVTETTGVKTDKTCRAVSCGTPAKVEHSLITPSELASSKASYGVSLLYVCQPGYTVDGKGSGMQQFRTTCEADKKFSALESCTAITCENLPTVKNAAATGGAVTFNETVEFECGTGYSTDGTADGDKTFTVTCQSTGVYSEPQICQKVSCGEPPDTAHAHHPMQEQFFEDKVEYECFSGFTLDGQKDGATKFTAECKADGTFSTLKQCVPKICGELTDGDFENANFKDEGEIHYPMSTEISCLDGYTTDATADGNKTFSVACLASGEFEKYDPKTCKPVVCGLPPSAPNATTKDNKMTMVFGDHVEYKCDVGFTTGGEQNAPMTYDVECLGNGGFSSPTPEMICKNVNDCEGHTCGPYGVCVDLIGPAPAYTCNCQYGYIIKDDGDGEKHCGNKDDCKGADCGVGVCKDLIGSYTCICPGGYYVGFAEDGKKSCIPLTCSETTPEVENGVLSSTKKSGPVVFPSTLTYKCNKGYSVDGTAAQSRRTFQAQCEADGLFHGLAECQVITCGTPPVFEHTRVVSPNFTDSVDYMEKAKYECDEGYTILGEKGGATTFEVECENNGHLTNAKVCEPVKCGLAPDFPNSKAGIANEMFFGQSATYECFFGYTTDGTAGGTNEFVLDCLHNGSFSYTGSGSVCHPISAEIPTIKNAHLIKYAGDEVDIESPPTVATYPNTITFQCSPGYTINGLSSGASQIVSSASWDGTFLPDLPTECLPITYVIRGLSRDAPTANYLDGVQVTIKDTNYEGTSSNGHFTLQGVPAGVIKVEYHKEGYISGEREIDLEADISTGGAADISMSPVMAADAWRVVLKWGVKPTDLDTYGRWNSYKACWYQKTQTDGVMSMKLEHDDTDSYGPETLHISGVGKCTGGAYFCDIKYLVNDYTESSIMGTTDVEVTLYNGDRIAGSWKIDNCESSVEAGQNWWHVFTIDGMTNQLKWNCNQGPSPPDAQMEGENLYLMNKGRGNSSHILKGNSSQSLRGKH